MRTNSDPTSPRRRRWPRWLAIALGVCVVLFLVARLVADPIAERTVSKWFAQQPSLEGTFERVHVTFFPPGMVIENLKVFESPRPKGDLPLVFADHVESRVWVSQLLRGDIVASATVRKAKLNYVIRKPVTEEIGDTTRRLKGPLQNLLSLTEKLPPMRLERMEIIDAEMLMVDAREEGSPKFWAHDADMTMENFATSAELSRGLPVVVALSATVEKSGAFSLFTTLNPFEAKPTFAGRAQLDGLELNELHDFIKAKSGVVLPTAEVNMVTAFEAAGGMVRGEVRPSIQNANPQAADGKIINKLKAALGDVFFAVMHKDADKRDVVTTSVPFEANLKRPKLGDLGIWAALTGVLKNAFIEGLSLSLSSVDADAANETEKKDEAKDDKKGASSRRGPKVNR